MKKISVWFAVVIAVLLPASWAQALQPDSLQRQELGILVKDMNNAIAHNVGDAIVSNMPSRLYQQMAKAMNTSEEALRADFKKRLNAQFSNLKDGAYRLDEKKIEFIETPNKRNFYGLVPTRLETDKQIVNYMTLAIFDNTQWHLIYGGQQTVQNPAFLLVYPDMTDVVIPAPVITEKK